MNEGIDFKALAAQLARPEGTQGIETANHMNTSNADMTRYTVDLLGCKNDESVLEIGPGNGRFAAYVLSQGAGIQYTGVDRSETMVAQGRQINERYINDGRARFEWTDGRSFPFADGAFDKIFTVNTLYFWDTPAIQLAEIRRVLKPGGVFCLAIASKAFMEQLPFTAYGFTLYTPAEAQELLLTNGFGAVELTVMVRNTVGAAKQELAREEVFLCAK